MIYAAYGSNLNNKQMLSRCPSSTSFKGITLKGWRLVFKGVADIEVSPKGKVLLGLYKITESCEKSLDVYEEYPTVYKKKIIKLTINERKMDVMFYIMARKYNYSPPTKRYFNAIAEGYKNWDFNINQLNEAAIHSINHNTSNGYNSKNWKENNKISLKFLHV